MRCWRTPASSPRGSSTATRVGIATPVRGSGGVERVADVPIYFADPLVRRAPSLQATADAKPPKARVHRTLLDQLGIAEGAQVKIRQGRGEAVLATQVDAGGAARRRAHRRRASVDLRPRRPVRSRDRRARVMDIARARAGLRSVPAWVPVWTLVKIVVIAVPLILAVAYLTLRGAQGHRLDAGAHRPEPRRSARAAAAVRRRAEDAVQGNHRPVGREPVRCSSSRRCSRSRRRSPRGRSFRSPTRSCCPNINAGLLYILAMTLDGRVRRDPRRLGVELEVRVPRLPALGRADRLVRNRDGLRAGRRADGREQPQPRRHRRAARKAARRTGTSGRCCRCSSSTSSRASPRPTAIRSTWPRASRRSSPASTSNTRASRSRCSSSPNT